MSFNIILYFFASLSLYIYLLSVSVSVSLFLSPCIYIYLFCTLLLKIPYMNNTYTTQNIHSLSRSYIFPLREPHYYQSLFFYSFSSSFIFIFSLSVLLFFLFISLTLTMRMSTASSERPAAHKAWKIIQYEKREKEKGRKYGMRREKKRREENIE